MYTTVYGEESQPAAIKLVPCDDAGWERQLSRWRETAGLSHPSLLPLLDCGRCEIQGIPFLYVVMERAEGSLAEVLTERPLTAAEAQEMVTSIGGGLRYLHEHGFVHGRVKPANILAAGDQIKLATDSVVRGNNPDEDQRSLGLTLAEALGDGDAASQVASYPAARRNHWAIYAIAALMIAITGIVLWLRSGPAPSPAPALATAQATASQAPITAPPEETAAPAKPNESWYVAAATYRRKTDAEKRARSITKKWPDFKAEIYSPANAGYYLVLLGSNLSQKAAATLQHRAITAGMPRDTYIKRLSH